ncbi:hypothetical protein SAMN05192553_101575 [Cyclobacterium xiamenense]|uniref:Cell division protein ZapB n=1 Tax=Cyclobacterium xiamenense TaxID=1297121 RepID=A0A1H6UE45_9BACT|nr:hypothetical protein [Cyclobacterium xiamenense]SEI86102.1 hypothetical protein SAMN05192553_101575 [Cyclobacterium xiamenense]
MTQGELPDKKFSGTENGKNILIVVLIILVILSGWRLFNDHREKSKKNEEILILTEDNSELNIRLDSMTFQLDLRIQEIERLGGNVDSLIQIKEQLVRERQLEINRTAAEIATLNAQIDTYSGLLKQKDGDILRLREQNQQLFSENRELKSSKAEVEEEVVKLNSRTDELEQKVTLASQLKAENIRVAAVNSRGREREDEFRNRQLSKLKVSFFIAENNVAPEGIRDVYVQVLTPNEQVIFDIAKGSGTFELDGKEVFYTAKQDFIFTNSQQQLTYYYEKGSDYAKGLYTVKVFSGGAEIGRSSFEVK